MYFTSVSHDGVYRTFVLQITPTEGIPKYAYDLYKWNRKGLTHIYPWYVAVCLIKALHNKGQ